MKGSHIHTCQHFTCRCTATTFFLFLLQPERPTMRAQTVLPNGLIERHAYSITRVTTVDIGSAIPKLQVRQIMH